MGEMLGFDNVNNAFGFVLMFYGLASFIGIPLAGNVGSCHSMIRLEIVTQTVVVHDLFY